MILLCNATVNMFASPMTSVKIICAASKEEAKRKMEISSSWRLEITDFGPSGDISVMEL